MTPTQIARRSDALYSGTTKRDMSYMVAYRESDIEDLKAENAKLRELLDYMTPIAWYAASERERDRMRELGIEVTS